MTEAESKDREYRDRESMWDDQWPHTRTGPGGSHPIEEWEVLDEEMPYPWAVGTTDVLAAIEDAEPYSPPIDAPVLPGGPGGIHMGIGFGLSADDALGEDRE